MQYLRIEVLPLKEIHLRALIFFILAMYSSNRDLVDSLSTCACSQ
jgi:hypothetical protein